MFTKVPVAACSFKPRKFDISSNADRLEELFRRASSGKALIAVAPEGALDGYVVMPIIRGEVASSRMNEVAISIRNAYIVRFKNLAKELEMCLVFGFAERINNKVFKKIWNIEKLFFKSLKIFKNFRKFSKIFKNFPKNLTPTVF